MIKSILKTLLFISLILAVGQIKIASDTLGAHFVFGVKSGAEWTGKKVMETKWLAGIELPSFLKDLTGENTKKRSPTKKQSESFTQPRLQIATGKKSSPAPMSSLEGELEKSDRDEMLKLLQ